MQIRIEILSDDGEPIVPGTVLYSPSGLVGTFDGIEWLKAADGYTVRIKDPKNVETWYELSLLQRWSTDPPPAAATHLRLVVDRAS